MYCTKHSDDEWLEIRERTYVAVIVLAILAWVGVSIAAFAMSSEWTLPAVGIGSLLVFAAIANR